MPDLKARSTSPLTQLLTLGVWLPILLYLLLTGIGLARYPEWKVEPTGPLMTLLNLVFRLGVGAAVAYVAAGAYIRGGTLPAVALGCGMLAMGVGSTIAMTAFAPPISDPNAGITMHNLAVLLAGACLLAAAAATLFPLPLRLPGSRGGHLWLAYLGVLLSQGLCWLAIVGSVFPPFTVPGQGPTGLRQFILGLAILEFVLAGAFFWQAHLLSRFTCFRWYAVGLLLFAVGLTVILQERTPGSLASWAGRWGQFLGGAYIFGGLLGTAREARSRGLSSGQVFAVSLLQAALPYRSLIDSTSEAVVALDTQGAVLYWNEAARQRFGYGAAEVFGVKLFDRIVPSTQVEATRAALARLTPRVGSAPAQATLELVLEDREGRQFRAEVTFYGDPATYGYPTVCVIRDITEQKQAEEALRRLNESLEARVQERTAALHATNIKLEAASSHAEEANIRLEEINVELEQEVLERQRAEAALADANAALRESEQRYRWLVDLAPDAVLVHLDGRIVYANAAASRLYGAGSLEHLRGRHMLDLVHPEERDLAWTRTQQAQAGGPTPLRELRHLRLDGQEVQVETTAAPVDWQGKPAVQIIVRDITDRKKKEAELQKLNRTLEALRKSNAALMRASCESEYLGKVCNIIANDCGYAMVWIGYAEEDAHKTVRPVAHAGFEDGYLDTLVITWADTERGQGPTGTAIRTGKTSMCRNMLTDPRFRPWQAEALRRGYASSLVLPLLDNGKAIGAVSIYSREPDPFTEDEVKLLAELADDLAYGITAIRLRDAHARAEEALRQSEERYRALVELSPDAIFINRNNRIVFVNPAALRLFGASMAEQILGRSPFELFHPEYHALVRERIQALLEGRMTPLIEEKIKRLDGTVVDVEIAGSPFTDMNGVAIQVILRDITARKRAEAALREAHEELEHRVQERTADLSRAVKTLEMQSEQLRALASELTLAEQRERRRVAVVLHDSVQQLLVGARLQLVGLQRVPEEAVSRTAREVEDLINQSLAASRTLTYELSPPMLYEGGLVPALEWLARWTQDKHGLAVEVSTAGPVKLEAEDARILLFQAVRELLFNVVKHAKAQAATVHVDRLGDQIRVLVEDDGVGFDPAQRYAEGGHAGGFGLLSVRERLNLLGGRMEIDSTPGRGSRFTLWAPIRRAGWADLPMSVAHQKPERAGPAGYAGAKIRVLLVDDHRVVRQGLARLLSAEPDFEIVGEAQDGKLGVALAGQLMPDVILMDVGMPVMNGIEATRLIHDEFPAVRVIGLSMFGEADHAKAMRDAGAVNYLIKSDAADVLVAAIRNCVERQEEQ
jgi:PAS domain S-box-containing protein